MDKTYKFYGWEHADVPPVNEKYKAIRDPRNLYDMLSDIWCAETCAPRMRHNWSREDMTMGQCSVTAFLAQDIFGGKVFGVTTENGNTHCYNVVGECVFDLTSEQFHGQVLNYENNPEQFREVHFSKTEKKERYEYLKRQLQDKLENTALRWEEVKREHLIRDEWIDLRRSAYRLPDGSVWEPYYTYSRRDYVVIVASDTEGRYLGVRQFRQGINDVTTEFPAGGIERGEQSEYRVEGEGGISAAEALEAAKRELLEETGYKSDEWTHLLTIPSNATIADNYVAVFRAVNCRKEKGQDLDETEFLHVRLMSEEEIESRIHGGDFLQAVHVMAWLLAKGRDDHMKDGEAQNETD